MYYSYSTVSVQPSIITEDHLRSYPTSWYEAEQIWEGLRQQVRVRIASLPTYSFERTMLEEDERFFNTFPNARLAAINDWIAVTFPYASWLEMPTFSYQYSSMGIDLDQSPNSFHSPVPKYTTYTLAEALNPAPSTYPKVASQPFSVPSEPREYQHVPEDLQECVSSPQEDMLFTLQVVSPARRPARNTRTILRPARTQKNTYPTVATVSPTPISLPSPPRIPAPVTVPSMPSSPKPPRRTGDWETDAIAAAEYEYLRASANARFFTEESPAFPEAAPAKLVIDTSIVCSSEHDHASSRARSHPYAPAKPKSSSPSCEETPHPQPRRKRSKLLRDKDGKPIMACWFCRGRKIACGPPPPGSDDPTCNQCLRRGQSCHYPTVSRRGQRKKKTDLVDAQSSSSQSPPSSPSSYRGSKSHEAMDLPALDDLYSMSDDEDDSGSEWDGSNEL